ncbi:MULTISPECIES: helix-turn-helix domain-containing protein [Pseudomonas]|uniref:helix-turn-helix domain-containing protein n=1 Tax=Pseudomonas TaxID=286 RepID=UPI001A265C90|nr:MULTISPECIES: resolvase [Pseudomonas]MBJ7370641.1 resolvase [Pseudomonas sp.]WGT34343.1 resolvase [Pseudomonas atacamensis]
MSLKKEIGAAIRSIRTVRGADYGDLAEVSVKANINKLEQGMSNITLEKLVELSRALQFDAVALLAMCVAMQNEEHYSLTLKRAAEQLHTFQAEGGMELFSSQLLGRQLLQRPRGKPKKSKNEEAVRDLKAAGFSQAEVVEKLGLAKSTVHRYWQS